ncbi:uncharacterized protein F4807DRAFT_468125 [Annulohypoxylon truncatum]|uniref:uncharacterized protein n=1 Tax=Annulohypoxylon truncatum TaxID=327061 RepID=UPI002008E69C|nr:uncharacterized protein F4807DRAFT_468125 [Annulohypoxylon truncatum]KAI1214178.1 hypothetical protein F4807DRAFT_468125 [Annulohypoxylon truncatum]
MTYPNLNDFNGGHLIAGRNHTLDEELWSESRAIRYYSCAPITYGIELQFLIPVLIQGRPDPNPDDPRKVIFVNVDATTTYSQVEDIVTQNILHVLRGQVQVPATTHLGPPFPTREAFAQLDQESQAVSDMGAYEQWIVTTDKSLVPENDQFLEHYDWIGVKVKSNKRDMSNPDHFDQVGRVIEALRANFRVRLPPTTSLFIHVGEAFRDEREWQDGPRHLRAFCTMWWFLERYVLQLAHPSRRTHPECLPLREHSRIAQGLEDLDLEKHEMHPSNFAHMYQQMQYIVPLLTGQEMDIIKSFWKAKDAAIICQRMTVPATQWVDVGWGVKLPRPTEARGSVGFSGFCRWGLRSSINLHNNGHTGTFEFRSMESTLDPLPIINWLAVVTRLYDFSRRGNTGDILGILQKALAFEPQYSGVQLLQDLGLPVQAEYFQAKIERQPTTLMEDFNTLFVPVK